MSAALLLVIFCLPGVSHLPAAAAGEVICRAEPLPHITPGTTVEDGPPGGWTHLVFKTRCKLATGDIQELPEIAKELTELLFTAMLARVSPYKTKSGTSYRLEDVSIGVGAEVAGRDIVLSAATQKKLAAELGVLERVVLSQAEVQLSKTQRRAVSERMMLVDTPSFMVVGGQHRDVVLRYLFLVDPSSGDFASVVWLIVLDHQGRSQSVSTRAIRIASNLVTNSLLHVDGGLITLGIPSPKAFAAVRMPDGETLELPSELRNLAAQLQVTPEDAAQLEKHFREQIGFSPAL